MLGDAAQPAESDGSRNAAAPGPRHAAPRKPLLTRLHVPAGKAVALAAMPTAVLMGMGFTPHLAQADEMPKTPFKPGPCVSRADTPPPAATAKPTTGATTAPTTAAPKPTATADDSAKPAVKPAVKPAPSTASPAPAPTGTAAAPARSAQSAGTTPAPAPSPTATSKTFNPLDPLGLGGLLTGLLGGGSTPTTPAPTPTATAPAGPAPSTTAAPKPSVSPTATTPSSGTSTSAAGGSKSTATKNPLSGTADAVKKAVKPLADATAGNAAKSTAIPLDGSQSYPCPTYDAKALAAADVEGGIPLLPDQPFTLKTTKLTLHGLSYHGIVKVRTWNGQVKDALKFTASGIDIDNLWQIVEAPNGTHTWVKARAGSTSTFRNGTVTLYTESLSGNLLGLIPVTFTPKAPPPLTLPELFFTNATVVNAGQFGGDLHVPGMQVLPNQP